MQWLQPFKTQYVDFGSYHLYWADGYGMGMDMGIGPMVMVWVWVLGRWLWYGYWADGYGQEGF